MESKNDRNLKFLIRKDPALEIDPVPVIQDIPADGTVCCLNIVAANFCKIAKDNFHTKLGPTILNHKFATNWLNFRFPDLPIPPF